MILQYFMRDSALTFQCRMKKASKVHSLIIDAA